MTYPHTSIEAGTLAAIDMLGSIETRQTRWLLRAGPIARQLNEQSANDPQDEEQPR
jgi:hypothetical protein